MEAGARLLNRLAKARIVPHQSTRLFRILNSNGAVVRGQNEVPLFFPSALLGQLYLAEQANMLPMSSEKPLMISSIVLRGSELIEGKEDRRDLIESALCYFPTDTLLFPPENHQSSIKARNALLAELGLICRPSLSGYSPISIQDVDVQLANKYLQELDPFSLVALDLVVRSAKSLIISLGHQQQRISGAQAVEFAESEEFLQREKWGSMIEHQIRSGYLNRILSVAKLFYKSAPK